MKILKYLTVVASIIFFASCEKNELTYAGEQDMPSNMAEFRLHYVEPITSGSTTRFDSIYVNDVLYANSTNAYGVYNVLPNANKFYVAPVGEVNIKGWKKAKYITKVILQLKQVNRRYLCMIQSKLQM